MEVQGQVSDGWTRFEAPSAVENGANFFCDQIFYTNHRAEVFVSPFDCQTLKWEKMSYFAEKIVFSQNCDLVWRISALCAWSAKVASLKR
jgi:hypothetical protein